MIFDKLMTYHLPHFCEQKTITLPLWNALCAMASEMERISDDGNSGGTFTPLDAAKYAEIADHSIEALKGALDNE